MSSYKPLSPFEYLANAEKAAALGRIAAKMEKALAALGELDRELASTPAPPADKRAARASLLAEAAELVWFYMVQREVMGFREHQSAFEFYGIPGEVLARMGPRLQRT